MGFPVVLRCNSGVQIGQWAFGGGDREVQLVDPGIAVRARPHSQLDTLAIAALLLPHALPVPRPGIVEPAQCKDQGQRFWGIG